MSRIRLSLAVEHNAGDVARRLHATRGRVERGMQDAAHESLGILANAAREAIPEGHSDEADHVHTRDKLVSQEEYSEGRATVGVGTDDEIARILEYGSRSHVIEPKPERIAAYQAAHDAWVGEDKPKGFAPKRPVLAFKIDGELVFATRVNHPGTRPYHWLENTMVAADEPTKRVFERNFAQALEER